MGGSAPTALITVCAEPVGTCSMRVCSCLCGLEMSRAPKSSGGACNAALVRCHIYFERTKGQDGLHEETDRFGAEALIIAASNIAAPPRRLLRCEGHSGREKSARRDRTGAEQAAASPYATGHEHGRTACWPSAHALHPYACEGSAVICQIHH
jgi:hypothetical protein